MANALVLNMVRVACATTGTGTLSLGPNITGFLTMAQAGGVDGQTYAYAIEADYTALPSGGFAPVSREQGFGVWSSGSNTLTRNVVNSTNGNALIVLHGDEQVFITPLAGNVPTLGRVVLSATTNYYVSPSGSDVTGDGSVGSPWQTLQHANDFVQTFIDFGGQSVIITLKDTGTYAGCGRMGGYVGGGTLHIVGATTNELLYKVLDNGGAVNNTCFEFTRDTTTTVILNDLTFKMVSGGFAVSAQCRVNLVICEFLHTVRFDLTTGTQTASGYVKLNNLANILTGGNLNITGPVNAGMGTFYALNANDNSENGAAFLSANHDITLDSNKLVTLYILCDNNQVVQWSELLIAGGVITGKRFQITNGGLLALFSGAGVTSVFGDQPGTVGSGGRLSLFRASSVFGADTPCDRFADYETTTTGFALTMTDGQGHLILTPAGPLASGSVTLAPNPLDGQQVRIRTTQTIASFTVLANAGQSILNPPSTLLGGTAIDMIYRQSNTTWYAELAALVTKTPQDVTTAAALFYHEALGGL